ncbi:DUF4350 domain-containing protein [Bacillus sp. DJP31]|uniref:DUF4350 domain-containing protein n=1 Tax=Bacillus sp. DJP31 TaxID=3409789 RepID=UPI003BB627AA
MQKFRQIWLWLVAILILFSIFSYLISSQKPKEFPDYVFHSPSPSGLKAIYTYLENEKIPVEAWSYDPKLLTDRDANHLLIMVEPSYIPEKEVMKEYMDFIEAGNTILLLKENPKGMFGVRSAFIEQDPFLNEAFTIIFDKDLNEYKAKITSNVRLISTNKDEVLLQDEFGPIAIKQSIGKGELIVSNSPGWMTNDALLINDHIPLVLSLVEEGKSNDIWFDEYSHGGQNASTLFTLYPKWFLLIMFQGGLFTIVWLWSRGKRFGPILVEREETVRFSDEGINALAAWYQRSRRYHDSLVIQADYLKVLLYERWGTPYNKDWIDLATILERKWTRIPKPEIRPFLNGITLVLAKEKISKQEYLLWSKKLDTLREEVEEG